MRRSGIPIANTGKTVVLGLLNKPGANRILMYVINFLSECIFAKDLERIRVVVPNRVFVFSFANLAAKLL